MADDVEPYVEPVPLVGWWESVADDATGTVTATGPEDWSENRPYTAVEQVDRAAQIMALRARERAEALSEAFTDLEADMEHTANLRDHYVSLVAPEDGAEGYRPGAVYSLIADTGIVEQQWHNVGDALSAQWSELPVSGVVLAADTIDASKVRMDEAFANAIAANLAAFKTAYIGVLDADAISVGSMWGWVIRGATFISAASPDPGAENITIENRTLTVNRDNGEVGLYQAITLGGASADELSMRGSDGVARVHVDGGDGSASFQGNVGAGSLDVAGRDFGSYLDEKPSGALTHSWASGNSIPQIGGDSSYGLWRLSWMLQPRRRYKLCMKLQVQGTPGDFLWFAARHTTGTTMPTVNTAAVDEAYEQIGPTPLYGQASTTMYPTFILDLGYATPMQCNVLISARNVTADRPFRLTPSSGPLSSHVWLEDIGPLGEATAVVTAGGGAPYTGEVAPPDAPQPTRRRVEHNVTSWKNFHTSNSSDTLLEHGRLNGGPSRVAQLLFPAIPAGATNVNAYVTLSNAYTWYGSGMTAYVGGSTDGSLRSSPVTSATSNAAHSFSRSQQREIQIQGWTAAHRSVWLGVGAPSGNQFFGRFNPSAKIVYTYDL